MTARSTAWRRAPVGVDEVPALHNCGPGPRSVYRTGSVGFPQCIAPARLLLQVFAAAGLTKLPASLFAADTGVHLHPAVVSASLQVTLERMARVVPVTAPVRDEELFARLRTGRKALGAPRRPWIEHALGLLDEVRMGAQLFGEGTRFHGVARWRAPDIMGEIALPDDDGAAGRDPHAAAVAMTVLGWASPPVASLRRAPTLEYFRAYGYLEYRNFGPWVAA